MIQLRQDMEYSINTLVINYLSNVAIHPDAPWFTLLLVNPSTTKEAHTQVISTQWPFSARDEINNKYKDRTNKKNKNPKSLWYIALIIGPFKKKIQSLKLNYVLEQRSRGAISRTAKAQTLAEFYELEVYGDLKVIFGD